MIYRGFRCTIEYDTETEIYHGEIVICEDVITNIQGKTIKELIRAFRDSCEEYLETDTGV